MLRNEVKAKTGRKPLRDVSNNNGGGRSSKSVNLNKMQMESQKHNEETCMVEDDDSLDRLLLIQSDLSSLLRQAASCFIKFKTVLYKLRHVQQNTVSQAPYIVIQHLQIDEIVVQAFRLKTVSKEGRDEIESFSRVLSNMVSSLKPWVPRFLKVLSSPSVESESQPQQVLNSKLVSYDDRDETNVCDSPEEIKLDSLISPSPLVSWRANCTIERGRQMFVLTPLPISKALSSKCQEPSESEFNKLLSSANPVGKSTFLTISRDITDLLDSAVMKPTPIKPAPSVAIEEAKNQEHGLISSPRFPKRDSSMLVMTPCLKMSPPKSCMLLEPISEIYHIGNNKVRKSTPFPVGIHYSDSETSESSGSDASQGLALKYPELLGIHQISKPGIGKKVVEESPDWLTSPPKTCVLLEPLDESSMELDEADNSSRLQITNSVLKQQISKLKDDVSKDHNQTKKSCNQESTPMWQEPESSFQTGKRPGENTLKKELWTKFEAASTYGLKPNIPTVQETTQKGFLDLLEEASCG